MSKKRQKPAQPEKPEPYTVPEGAVHVETREMDGWTAVFVYYSDPEETRKRVALALAELALDTAQRKQEKQAQDEQ